MKFFSRMRRRDRSHEKRRAIDLNIERFEDRFLLATFTVKSVNDTGTDSLRQAILDSNASAPGTNSIVFNIPNNGTGIYTINLNSTTGILPTIQNNPVTIDGTSESTFLSGAPAVIVIDGKGLTGDGLLLGAGSTGSTIQALDIVDFAGAGIHIQSNQDLIIGNLLGVGPSGTTAGPANVSGVWVNASSSNTIGGLTVGAPNSIGFNTTAGVSISGTSATDNVVEGNFIGTNSGGTVLGNGEGVVVNNAPSNTIGGTTASAANVIGFNTTVGVSISGSSATGNLVAANFIGTDSGGTANLGNGTGVIIAIDTATTGNTIGGTAAGAGNVIADNSLDAVDVNSGSGNAIRENLIYGNGGGIKLVGSANNHQAPPSQLAVASVPNLTTIDFTLTGSVGQSYTVNFFASNGSGGPAGQFLGTTTTAPLTSTTQGFTIAFPFSTPLSSTEAVTATATGPDNSTSQFAGTAVRPASPFVVTNTTDGQPGSEVGSLRQAILDANSDKAATGTDDITFAITGGTAPYTINLTSGLPAITVPVTIDGTSQAGYSPTDLPVIEINGVGLSSDGLVLGTGSDGSTIEALDLAAFHGAGIRIESTGDAVTGSFLGTDSTGLAPGPGNLEGILIDNGATATIGGTTSASGNTIGFNTVAGIQIIGQGAGNTNALIASNDIGTDPNDDSLSNGYGVEVVNASGNTIGGSATSVGNLIGNNVAAGVEILSGNGNVVRSNTYTGTNGALTSPSVAANDIVLGTGANQALAAPQFIAASLSAGNTSLSLALSTTFGAATTLDVYLLGSNPNQRTFVASEVVPAGEQPASLPVTNLAPGDQVIATVTVEVSGTSTFSAPVVVASATTVTNTNSTGTGSLANAISTDTSGSPIVFNIPGSGSTFVIDLTSSLTIAVPLRIDGTSESAFLGRNATIALNGGNGSFGALILGPSSGGSTIEGLEIEDFGAAAILVQSADNTIGGTSSGQGNILVSNSSAGVSITGAAASGNVLVGNFIGSNPAGASGLGNVTGILIDGGASNNTIGGTSSAAANVIDSNSSAGVSITGASTTSNLLEGNFIGTNAAGSKLGNVLGVVIEGASGNTLGGSVAGAANAIAFNGSDSQHGAVTVHSATGDAIQGNLIYGNTGTSIALSGINLTGTGNHNLATPVISQVTSTGATSTTVNLDVSKMTAGTYSLDVFARRLRDTISPDQVRPTSWSRFFRPARERPDRADRDLPGVVERRPADHRDLDGRWHRPPEIDDRRYLGIRQPGRGPPAVRGHEHECVRVGLTGV